MISFALIHLMMIPIAYILEIFPFLKPIAESSMELLLMLSEMFRG